jgi:hypothetical protein
MEKPRSEPHGQIPTEVLDVVMRAFHGGFSVQSDFFRQNPEEVACAASLGLISTLSGGNYGKMWRVTIKGLQALEESCQ